MRKIVVTIFATLFAFVSYCQTSLSFYHLGRTTYQNSSLNPAWVPDNGKVFVGLPGISGVHLHVNNKLSYNEAFTKENNSQLLDIEKIIPKLQNQNMVAAQAEINLLHFGVKTNTGVTFSFFANERLEANALYPKKIVEFAWQGNDNFLDDEIKLGQVGAYANHFREFGIGIAMPVNRQLDFGIRGKYLIGFFNASTPPGATASLTTSGEYFQLDGELNNAQLRTSGKNILDGGDLGSHLVMNGNRGLAVDIGAEYKLNRYYSIAGSILDLGWINWKEDIVNYTLTDTTFRYSGVNLEDLGDVQQTLQDSLIDKFEVVETNETYRTYLPIRAYGSWIYHYDKQTDFYATVGTRLIQGQFKMLYGGGITHDFGKVFTLSASAMKLPQQFFNVGAAFALNAGPVQWYMAADQVINFSVPDAKAFDIRFGINLRFNGRDNSLSSNSSVTSYSRKKGKTVDGTLQGSKGIDTGAFLGKKVRTKKRDGIYSIIPRQKKDELEETKRQKKKVVKKSLNGREKQSGKKTTKKKVTRKSLNGRTGSKNGEE